MKNSYIGPLALFEMLPSNYVITKLGFQYIYEDGFIKDTAYDIRELLMKVLDAYEEVKLQREGKSQHQLKMGLL